MVPFAAGKNMNQNYVEANFNLHRLPPARLSLKTYFHSSYFSDNSWRVPFYKKEKRFVATHYELIDLVCPVISNLYQRTSELATAPLPPSFKVPL